MAYDEEIATRVRKALGRKKTDERKMFGGIAFMLNGHMCCGVSDDKVVLRLGNEGAAAALGESGVDEMDFTGKPIRSMVYLTSGIHTDEKKLKKWIDQAARFVASLPPK